MALIDDVAACKVVPSYISYLIGLKLDRIAPLNFRLPNLIGVNDGIGVMLPVPQQNKVPAWMLVSDSSACTDADAVCFFVESVSLSVVVEVLVLSLIANWRESPGAALIAPIGEQKLPALGQKSASAAIRLSEPLLHPANQVKSMEYRESPLRKIWGSTLGEPVAGQVTVGRLRVPVKLVIPVAEVAI